jgi:hypothetical protein
MKAGTIFFAGIFMLFLSGCTLFPQTSVPENTTTDEQTTETEDRGTLTEQEARAIAEATCIKGGESLEPGYYNENSKTWWFDANLNATQEGCNPACVVSEETGTAEINWRCTGLLPSEDRSDTDGTSSTLPATCVDEVEGEPVITSLSTYAGSVGTTVEINGCNFAGFEGDLNAWLETPDGEKGILYGTASSNAKKIVVVIESSLCQTDTSYSGLPCGDDLVVTPGPYNIFVMPWGNISNKVGFEVE